MTIEILRYKLTRLKEEYRILDEKMTTLMSSPLYDQVSAQRLKKRKGQLKDEIVKIQTRLIPDIIA